MEPIYFDELLGASPGTQLATVRRWYEKANAVSAAWRLLFGQEPPKDGVILALAVAQLENRCGDLWPGAYNWGCVQQRVPTALEAKVLIDAGIPPSPKNVPAAQVALAKAVEEGRAPPNPGGILQCDSSPRHGYYWVFFATFPNDAKGSERFIKVLAANRPSCKMVLESPAASEQELATCMYASNYYEGTHNPTTPEGRQANINSYASAIRSWTPSIRSALSRWVPGAKAPSELPPPDPSSNVWVQWALNRLGIVPSLSEDGELGPKSRAAIREFQKSHGLKMDGVAGPITRKALQDAMVGVLKK